MAEIKKYHIDSAELRRQAEKRLGERTATTCPSGSGEDPLRLLHELQVHQIELEMQIEELLHAKDAENAALKKYTDLYEFAPVGYVTLDRTGAIRSVNLAGAGLIGIAPPGLLVGVSGFTLLIKTVPSLPTSSKRFLRARPKSYAK